MQKTLADAKNLYWARQVAIQLKVASAWVDRAFGRNADAVTLMQEAAKAEETSETHDTLSPGPIGMTAHEALGLLLLELRQQHLVLARPFGRQVGEADYSHAMRKASFDPRLDEVGREEGERDRHVDLADAAAVARQIGTLVESHLSMICRQTTHVAILLSLLESRECVTE